jgi:hypothetical protein
MLRLGDGDLKSFVRSAVAVMMGFMVWLLALAFAKPLLLKAFGITHGPLPPQYLLTYAVAGLLIAALAGFVTAVLARYRPIEHAAALSGIVFLLNWLQYRVPTPGLPGWFPWIMGAVPPFMVLTGSAFYPAKAAETHD